MTSPSVKKMGKPHHPPIKSKKRHGRMKSWLKAEKRLQAGQAGNSPSKKEIAAHDEATKEFFRETVYPPPIPGKSTAKGDIRPLIKKWARKNKKNPPSSEYVKLYDEMMKDIAKPENW